MTTKLEDSNIANYGSGEHIAARLEAAKTAEEWIGAGEENGLQIWRIEKLNVKPWPKEKYGQFFDGDSFIILYTYTDDGSEKKKYNVHFWIGQHSTQDEYTIAAYKTVELDDLLGDLPIQFREVQEHESDEFLTYFDANSKHPLRIESGGIDSGFNTVKPEEYKPKLLHVKGKKNPRSAEVPLRTSSLNLGDVFLLDAGLKLYIWIPEGASAVEKFAASRLSVQIRDERGKCQEIRLDQDGNDEFWAYLDGEKSEIKSAELGGRDDDEHALSPNSLWRLSDASGTLKFEKIATGKISSNQLDGDDVFIIDLDVVVFVWIGKGASLDERKNAMRFANSYLARENKPMWTPVTRVFQGQEHESKVWGKYIQ